MRRLTLLGGLALVWPGAIPARPVGAVTGAGVVQPCAAYAARQNAILRYAVSTVARGAPPRPTHPAGVIARTQYLTGRPYGAAIAANGTIYVALIGSNSLLRGSLASMEFGSAVEVGPTPPHVVINRAGTLAYATLQTGRGVAVVDVSSNALLSRAPLTSDGFNLAVSSAGDRVYATTAAGALYVLSVSGSVLDTLSVGPAANGLAFAPDECTLYVTSRDAGTVKAISTVSHAVTRTYRIGGMPQRIAVAPDGSELYVANEASGLDVVNVETGEKTTVAFGTAAYGLGLTPDGEQLYVLLPATGEVRILSRRTRAPLRTLVVGGTPRNVAFEPRGTAALVTTEEAVVFIH